MHATSITAARTAAGLSQAELARRLSVSPVSVHRWERGTRTPDAATLARIDAELKDAAAGSRSRSSARTRPVRAGSDVYVLVSGGKGLLVSGMTARHVDVISLDGLGSEADLRLAAKRMKSGVLSLPEVAAFVSDALVGLLAGNRT